jgi:hypothetical protein
MVNHGVVALDFHLSNHGLGHDQLNEIPNNISLKHQLALNHDVYDIFLCCFKSWSWFKPIRLW